MPFGSESDEDPDDRCWASGPGVLSPMPFGSESDEDTMDESLAAVRSFLVTNAFRQ